jgi:predicted GNAT family acetyltransferase
MNEELDIKLRPYEPSDFNFIINSWLNSSHELFPARKINKKYFNKVNTPILSLLLSQCTILVACNKDDANHIFGYLVYERIANEIIIYWLYVKKELRNFGIASKLINKAIPEFTKQPIAITSIPNLKAPIEDKLDVLTKYNLIFDPYIVSRKIQITM